MSHISIHYYYSLKYHLPSFETTLCRNQYQAYGMNILDYASNTKTYLCSKLVINPHYKEDLKQSQRMK